MSVAALACYVGIAFGVGNLYPFSTFSMYAGEYSRTASRLLARDAQGRMHEVEAFHGWHCATPPVEDSKDCPRLWPYYYIPYLDGEVWTWIRRHPGPPDPARPVALVRRVWHLHEGDGPPRVEDCVVDRCEVAP